MLAEKSLTSKTARVALYVVVLVFSAIGFFAYYRSSISSRREALLNSATDALALAANDLGSRLDNWTVVVGRARQADDFQTYIHYLVPGLEAGTGCETKGTVSATEGSVPRASLHLHAGEQFRFEFYNNTSECAVSDPETVDQFFQGLTERAFANVLLASNEGAVFYQSSKTGPRIQQLEGLLAAPQDTPQTNHSLADLLAGLVSTKRTTTTQAPVEIQVVQDAIAKDNAKNISQVTSFSNILSVKVDGEPFLLVIEPIPFIERDGAHLILAGLIKNADIDKLSKIWPKTIAAWMILGLVIIYSCVWSVSYIPMKSAFRPVRSFDVVLIVVGALIFCSAMTLAICQAYYVVGLNSQEQKLHQLASDMRAHLGLELCSFYHTLEGLTNSRELTRAIKARAADPANLKAECRRIPDFLSSQRGNSCLPEPGNIPASAIAYSYPFFDYVMWSSYRGDKDTGQIAKWSIRQELTPPTEMTIFDWFKAAREKRLYRIHAQTAEERRLLGADFQDAYVSPLRSPNTGEYLTVLVKPYDLRSEWTPTPSDKNPEIIGTITAILSSLNSPVFPAGYSFGVIGLDGTVLFSSDPRRNQRENFLQETGANDDLILAVRTRATRTLNLSLQGNNVLAHVLPLDDVLEGANWSVVVYRNLGLDQEIQYQVFIEAMKLSLPHLVEMLVLTLALWAFAKAHKTWYVLPREDKDLEYLVLTILLIFVEVVTWVLMLTGTRTAIFLEALLLPVLWLLLCVGFLGYCDVRSDRLNRLQNLLTRAEDRFGKLKTGIFLYSCALCCGLVLLAVLPTIGYYRVAFQMVNAYVATGDLITNTYALETRARSASQYYDQIKLPSQATERVRFIADRLAQSLDVYDTENWKGAGSVTFGDFADRVPLIDVAANALGFFSLRTPMSIVQSTSSSRQTFHIGIWPNVQFDYRSMYFTPDYVSPTPGYRAYHRLKVVVPDMDRRANLFLLVCAGALFLLVCWGVNRTLRALFLIGFGPVETWPEIRVEDFSSLDQNVLVLRVIGTRVAEALKALPDTPDKAPTVAYLNLPEIKSVDDLPDLSRAPAGPVFVDNFDVTFDSEETARAHLAILERLLFSSRRRVILASAKDPVDYAGEILALTGDHPEGSAAHAWFRNIEEQWNRVFLCLERRRFPIQKDTTSEMQLASRVYASCTDNQCAVLYQIAQGKWVNPNNEQALRGLISRGWVKLSPTPSLTKETSFLSVVTRENPALPGTARIARWNLAVAAGSGWTTVFTLMAAVVLLILSLTGKDLLQSRVGTLTGLFAGIPAALRVFSSLRNVANVPAQKDAADA